MIPVSTARIQGPDGRLLGFIDTDKNGNKQCKDFSGRILGFYDATIDVTKDFVGTVVARGECVSTFLYNNLGR